MRKLHIPAPALVLSCRIDELTLRMRQVFERDAVVENRKESLMHTRFGLHEAYPAENTQRLRQGRYLRRGNIFFRSGAAHAVPTSCSTSCLAATRCVPGRWARLRRSAEIGRGRNGGTSPAGGSRARATTSSARAGPAPASSACERAEGAADASAPRGLKNAEAARS